MQFIKFHGFGNDYLVFEAEQLDRVSSINEFARAVCDRHYGAGADGITVVSPSEEDDADFAVRIFNPDGSEAGLSGNGTRCAVAYLYYAGHWSGDELRLSTRTGLKRYFPRGKDGAGKFIFESELGRPKFDLPSIPMSISPPLDQVIGYILPVDGQPV